MNRSTSRLLGGLAALALLATSALAAQAPKKDIVDTAVSTKKFETLVAAVKAADLVQALKGAGPFTVFAPSDAAFQKLEKANPGILGNLLKPENKDQLTAILLYHVVSGKVLSKDAYALTDGAEVATLGGKKIKVFNKKGLKINDSRVLQRDVLATNGVIHVIDTVLLPPSS